MVGSRICQLCLVGSQPDFRPDTLDQVAILLPSVPREMGERTGFDMDAGHFAHFRPTVLEGEDWRTGQTVLDLIARNEAMLAV